MKSFLLCLFMFCCTPALADYGALLSKHLHQGQKQGINAMLVNYKAWGQDPLHQQTMLSLQKTNPDSFSRTEKLVFWINAYNFLTIDLIIKTSETKSIRNQGSFVKNVWKSHSWDINGKNYTLDMIEHEILRKMNEPRIHFALVCASLSCPDLRNKPYSIAGLEKELNFAMNSFLKDETKGIQGSIISPMFKWFAEDFGGETGVKRLLKLDEIKGYFDYNWALNSR
jgi:hypothetical protein